MKQMRWLMTGWLLLVAGAALGQVTNVQTETNSIRLEWKAILGNPYYVFSTPNLMEPAWSNRAPDGVVFPDTKGSSLYSMDEPKTFYCVAASNDYLVVDLAEGPEATNYPMSHLSYMPRAGGLTNTRPRSWCSAASRRAPSRWDRPPTNWGAKAQRRSIR